jgi:hypothetical protein
MKRLYRGGITSPLLHEIDAIAWKAMGWTETPEPPPTLPSVAPAPTIDPPQSIATDSTPAALTLINGSDVARDVAIIPTIGQGAAKVLIENRPDGGYASLEQAWELSPVLFEGRYKVDPEAVAQWAG